MNIAESIPGKVIYRETSDNSTLYNFHATVIPSLFQEPTWDFQNYLANFQVLCKALSRGWRGFLLTCTKIIAVMHG